MKRILDENAITEAKTTWEYYMPRIIKQAKMEKGVHIQRRIQEIEITDEDCKITKLTVMLTMYACIFYREQSYDSNSSIAIPDP